MAKTIKATAWTSTVVTAAANWLSSDVSVGGGSPVKHTLIYAQASAATVDLTMTRDDVVTVFPLNGGAAVSAKMYKEDIVVLPGTTYNLDHAAGSGAHKVFLIVLEDEDDLGVNANI